MDLYERFEQVDVFSINGDFSVPLSHAGEKRLSYGFEAAFNDVLSSSKGSILNVVNEHQINGNLGTFPVQTRYPDGGGTYTNVAVYGNYREYLSEKATFNAGIRFTQTWLTAKWIDETYIQLPDNDIALSNNAITASLGYVLKPTSNWQLSTVLSSGFRSPKY